MILATLILIGWLASGLAVAFVGGGAARIGDR